MADRGRDLEILRFSSNFPRVWAYKVCHEIQSSISRIGSGRVRSNKERNNGNETLASRERLRDVTGILAYNAISKVYRNVAAKGPKLCEMISLVARLIRNGGQVGHNASHLNRIDDQRDHLRSSG